MIAHQRLIQQGLATPAFTQPQAVVAWLGAVQAQEYGGAKWAVAQRMTTATEARIEQAVADGEILRTHVLRPTWHFVTPADIRWMLALTAPYVNTAAASYYRQYELDDAEMIVCAKVVTAALSGGKHLTRAALGAILAESGIRTDDAVRVGHIMGRLELDGLLCSGAPQGKQQTYALLEERVPPTAPLSREESLVTLALRYFTSHAPATLKDYRWWSGLPAAEAKTGLALIESELESETIGEQTYWWHKSVSMTELPTPNKLYLLPNFDEYLVAYSDRSASYDEAHSNHIGLRGNPIFANTLVLDGQVGGTWKRTPRKGKVLLEPQWFAPPSSAESSALAQAAAEYGAYLGVAVEVIDPPNG